MSARLAAVLVVSLLLAGCGRSGACSYPETIAFLPRSLRESSGLAASRRRPGVFWTLVDSKGDSAVFAVDRHGTLLQRVRVSGSRNRDWEDLASGPCPDGRGDCLWIAETGDTGGLDRGVLPIPPDATAP